MNLPTNYNINDYWRMHPESRENIRQRVQPVDQQEDPEELTTTKPRLHQIGMDEILFRCVVCGEEWLLNPLMFMDDPDPEKRSIIYCPGPKPKHLIPIAWGFDEDGVPV